MRTKFIKKLFNFCDKLPDSFRTMKVKDDEEANYKDLRTSQSTNADSQATTHHGKTSEAPAQVEMSKFSFNMDGDENFTEDHDRNIEKVNMMDSEAPQFSRSFGKNCVFLFYNNEPLVTIGPHCKQIDCS